MDDFEIFHPMVAIWHGWIDQWWSRVSRFCIDLLCPLVLEDNLLGSLAQFVFITQPTVSKHRRNHKALTQTSGLTSSFPESTARQNVGSRVAAFTPVSEMNRRTD